MIRRGLAHQMVWCDGPFLWCFLLSAYAGFLCLRMLVFCQHMLVFGLHMLIWMQWNYLSIFMAGGTPKQDLPAVAVEQFMCVSAVWYPQAGLACCTCGTFSVFYCSVVPFQHSLEGYHCGLKTALTFVTF